MRQLDANSYYSKHDIWLKLRIATNSIDKARENRRLKALDLRPHVGGRLVPDKRPRATRGEDFLYKGSDVIAWLDAGAPTDLTRQDSSGRSVVRSITNSKPAGISSRGSSLASERNELMIATHGAVAEFEAQVERNLRHGMSRQAAIRTVVHNNPELHRRFLQAVNVGRPKVQGSIDKRFSAA